MNAYLYKVNAGELFAGEPLGEGINCGVNQQWISWRRVLGRVATLESLDIPVEFEDLTITPALAPPTNSKKATTSRTVFRDINLLSIMSWNLLLGWEMLIGSCVRAK